MRYAGVQNHCTPPVPEAFVSEKNPLLKQVRRAAHQGALTSAGYALAEGPHLLEEALRSGAEVHAVITSDSARVHPMVDGARTMHVSDAAFARLATTESPQGVLALVRPPSTTLDALLAVPHALLVILDGIQDPGNAGAILRAAEAFGATGAVFLKGSVNPYNPKCLRGSAGSVFRLPLVSAVAVEEFLEACELPLYSTEPRATAELSQADLSTACGIIIGSEGHGVSQQMTKRATGVRIPTSTVESLNAAVAAGVCLYEARRQRDASRKGSGA